MPLPEPPSRQSLARLILFQEIRNLLLSPALWLMLIIISLLVGYSFIQAVDLFSRASRTALDFPELASGMTPMDGIFVPTFGAYYLSQTLLLPFVAIRLIGLDKQSGALKLMLQLPLSPLGLCSLKLTAMGLVWLLSLLPGALTLIIWYFLGGHLYLPEILVLLLGHGLYGLTVITIGMLAATVTDSLPTAAICCLAVTLGSWVLDFASAGQEGLWRLLGNLSLTSMLQQFENGLLSSTSVASFLLLALLFFSFTVLQLHPGKHPSTRIWQSLVSLLLLTLVGLGAFQMPLYLDATENRRHSFSQADNRALRQILDPLTLTIHLDPQDSRLQDMENDILGKLRRTVPHLTIRYSTTPSADLFHSATSDNYGLIQYTYGDRDDESYSNSEQEILSIIYTLADIQVKQEGRKLSTGYPLVAQAKGSGWWFYLLLPLLFSGAGLYGRKGKW